MSLAPSIAVPAPQSRFNWLPLEIGLFCLLWSFAFVAGKIGVTDCPPLILLAGALFACRHPDPRRLRVSPRGVAALLARDRDLRDPRRRQQRALSRPRLHRVEIGLGRPRRPDRLGQSGLHGGAGRAVPRRGADLAQGAGAVARHCRRRLHRLASHGGRDRQPARHPVHAGLARLHRRRHHPVQAVRAEGQPLDRQRHPESRRRHRADADRASPSPMSARSCRARGLSSPSRSSCWAARSSPISSGFIS